jgi:hypothetical protein
LLFGKVVFALPLLKGDEGNLVVLGKALNRGDELASDGLYHTGGGHLVPSMDTNKLQGAFDGLQLRDINVEIHPVDALHFQHHVLA